MIRFHQTFGAHAGRVVDFEKGAVTFGRQPTCDVVFDAQADLDASGNHAEVRLEGGQYQLLDVGSRNGTWLNGQRIQRAVVSTGDEIEFGLGGPRMRVEIVHFAGSSPAVSGQPAAQLGGGRVTGPMTPARPGQPTAAATPVPAVAPQSIDTNAPTVMADGELDSKATPPPVAPSPAVVPPQPFAPVPTPLSSAQPSPALQQPPAGPPPPADPAVAQQKVYGQRTVAMMMQSALDQARQQGATGGGRSTAFIRAIASEAATSSSRGLKVAVVVLSILFALAVVGLIVVVVINRQDANETRRETEQLQSQVNQGSPGPRIVAAYNTAIFLLVEQSARGERGICTAFAVRSDLLATNAHCVLAMERGQGQGSTYSALPNGAASSRVPIVQMWRHPGYVSGGAHPTQDVGIVQISGTTSVHVALADASQLQQLRTGGDIYVYGFPGDLADVSSPVATITNGVIGRMVAFDGTAADFGSAQLIQHSAFTSPGTSGSPLFNENGVVVAINAGTFRSAQTQEVVGPLGPRSQTVVTETGYKYGVRVDLLTSLLAGLNR